jgi:YHS domain-containing protein
MNKITALMLGFFLVGTCVVFAQEATSQVSSINKSEAQPGDAGNKFCPVSGRQIGVMGPGVTVQYNGKTYHLCCGGCISTFQSNPEKYSKIAESQTAPQQNN